MQDCFNADGRRQLRQSSEDVPAAAQVDRRRCHVRIIQGHQRFAPDLIEHANRWTLLIRVGDPLQTGAEILCGGMANGIRAGQMRQTLQRRSDGLKVIWLAFKYRNPKLLQLGDLRGGISAAPDEDQIGLES